MVVIPISLFNKTQLLLCKMKYASPNCMIRIEIIWNQLRNLYNSQSNLIPLQNFQHGSSWCDYYFPSKFYNFKIWPDVWCYSKLVSMHVCWYCICYIKVHFYCVMPYWEYQEKNIMIVLKSYEAVTGMWSCWWRHLSMRDNIWSSREENWRLEYHQYIVYSMIRPDSPAL